MILQDRERFSVTKTGAGDARTAGSSPPVVIRHDAPHERVEQRHGEVGIAVARAPDHALGDQLAPRRSERRYRPLQDPCDIARPMRSRTDARPSPAGIAPSTRPATDVRRPRRLKYQTGGVDPQLGVAGAGCPRVRRTDGRGGGASAGWASRVTGCPHSGRRQVRVAPGAAAGLCALFEPRSCGPAIVNALRASSAALRLLRVTHRPARNSGLRTRKSRPSTTSHGTPWQTRDPVVERHRSRCPEPQRQS